EKRTRRGKPFWGCTRYPECDWSAWDEPVARPCPNCASPYLVKKSSKTRGEFLRCQKCVHEYTPNADGGLDPAGVGVATPAERRMRGEVVEDGKKGFAKKPFTKKTAAGRTVSNAGATRAAAKKATGEPGSAGTKPAVKKSAVKKSAVKKSAAKKSAAKKAPAKGAAKSSPAKKS